MTGPEIAIGVDPSLTGTGLAGPEGRCLKVGQTGITTMSWAAQNDAIDTLVELIVDGIKQLRPDRVYTTSRSTLVVVEALDVSHAYGGIIPRVVLFDRLLVEMGRHGWEIMTAAATHRMRYATGKGAAKKEEVVDAVARRWPVFQTGGDNNKADAAVFCAMGMDWLGYPLAPVPETHQRALAGLRNLTDPPAQKKQTLRKIDTTSRKGQA